MAVENVAQRRDKDILAVGSHDGRTILRHPPLAPIVPVPGIPPASSDVQPATPGEVVICEGRECYHEINETKLVGMLCEGVPRRSTCQMRMPPSFCIGSGIAGEEVTGPIGSPPIGTYFCKPEVWRPGGAHTT